MRRIVLSGVAGAVATLLVAVTPAAASASGPFRASRNSPFAPNCNGAPQSGTNYPNAEVEPYIATDPTREGNQVAVWQQDRWSNGGANGLLARRSTDGGRTWKNTVNPPFTHCAGGNARNGGDFERASDPWVTFAPNGDAYFVSLAFNDSNPVNDVQVSKSRDGGSQWGPIRTVIHDTDPRFFNDKESITADPTNSQRVYVAWDRLFVPDLTGPDFFGPAYFSRTTNAGASFEPPRAIFDPGLNNQTIGNVVNVLPDGTLIDSFDLILNGALNVALIRSTDHGVTWSRQPTFVDQLGTIGVVDPSDGAPVRTGDILPILAADPRAHHQDVYAVWQDARFSGGQADQIAFSRSTNGGRTWSPAVRISPPGNVQAFTPTISVNSHGEIAVTYYDFTFDTASPTLDTDYWVTRSSDGGRTFSRRERITRHSFDMRTAPDAGGFFVGDYEGLAAASDRSFAAAFVLANNGQLNNRTDVFGSRIFGPFVGESAEPDVSILGQARTTGRVPGKISVAPQTIH
jgi:hypothetical protein